MIKKDKAYEKETSYTLLLGASPYGKCKLLIKLEESFDNINSFRKCIRSRDYIRNNIKYHLIYGDDVRFSKILAVSVHEKGEDINIIPICSLQMDRLNRNVMVREMNESEKEIAKNNIYCSNMV